MTRRVLWMLLVATSAAGCATSGGERRAGSESGREGGLPGTLVGPLPESARSAFRELEARMLQAVHVEFEFEIEAEGAVAGGFDGTFRLTRDDRVEIEADGELAGNFLSLRLEGDGNRMRGGPSGRRFDTEQPPTLREALVIGLTRMGLLHNLAMLSAGAPPDGLDGDVREWVQAVRLTGAAAPTADGGRAIGFQIVVDGEPSGSAALVVDPATGLPRERRQLVRFEAGEMRVHERYRGFELR